MKLASLRAGRDGRLVVVDAALRRAVSAEGVAPTLQAALDDWERCAPGLAEIYADLCRNARTDARDLDPAALAAPLPRAYQWLDGSAYLRHVELARRARGAELPPDSARDPLMYQGGSDVLLGPRDPVRAADEAYGIDLEAEIAAITTDVPQGVDAEHAAGHVALLTLVNDVSLRNLIPAELAKGFGFVHGKPASAFGPVAVSPDALGPAWDGRRLHGALCVWRGETCLGRPDPGIGMTFDFGDLIAHAARTRALGAGSLIGSGTVSNAAPGVGCACIAERRALETIEHGAPRTPFLAFGERVRIEFVDARGESPFGALDQRIERI